MCVVCMTCSHVEIQRQPNSHSFPHTHYTFPLPPLNAAHLHLTSVFPSLPLPPLSLPIPPSPSPPFYLFSSFYHLFTLLPLSSTPLPFISFFPSCRLFPTSPFFPFSRLSLFSSLPPFPLSTPLLPASFLLRFHPHTLYPSSFLSSTLLPSYSPSPPTHLPCHSPIPSPSFLLFSPSFLSLTFPLLPFSHSLILNPSLPALLPKHRMYSRPLALCFERRPPTSTYLITEEKWLQG